MKKLLLSMLVVVLGLSNAFAYQVGDYIYTRNGRFKVTGENLLVNGDFQQGLETGSITNLYGMPLNTDTFALQTEGGPNGLPYIQVVSSAGTKNLQTNYAFTQAQGAATAHLFASILRTSGQRYVLTYKAKSGTEGVTITTSITSANGRSGNYQAFVADSVNLPTAPGSKATINNAFEWYANEWKEFAYDYTSETDGFLKMEFYNLSQYSEFADFGIYPVELVSDDRLVQEAIEQVQFYIDNKELFPNQQEILTEAIMPMLEEYKNNENYDEVNSLLAAINSNTEDDPIKAFLDANSVDITEYFTNFYDGGSGWSNTGGRWGTSGAGGHFNSGYIKQEIQTNKSSNSLPSGSYYQTVDLPAGKYLYVVKAQAYNYGQDGTGKSSNYYIPRYLENKGLRAFINNDSINMDDVPGDRAKVYMKVLEAGDGDKTVGFFSPGTSGIGGRFNFDNLQLRLMGKTAEDVKIYFNASVHLDAQNALKIMIDSAKTVHAKNMYVYGKTVLNDSIAISDNILATLTTASDENIAALKAQLNYMRAAINAYYALNAEYVQLGNDIENCKTWAEDDTRPKGKDVFQTAIEVADNYYKAQTEFSRDSLTLVQTDSTLLAARQQFLIVNATYKTPAEITIKNNSFQTKNTNGWEQDGRTDGGAWKFGSDSNFEDGYCIRYNRGNSAEDAKYVYQEIKIDNPGVYEFKAQIAANNSKNNTDGLATQCYIYIGGDSLEVCTKGSGDGTQNSCGEIRWFTVRTIINDVNTHENGMLRFGLDKKAYKINMTYMGSTHVLYYGAYDAYLRDSSAIVIKPTKDSLQVAINNAQALKDEARNPNNVDTTPFTTAISIAQSVHDKAESTLEEVLAQFTKLENATEEFTFSGVWPAEGKYYDHSKLLKNATFEEIDSLTAGYLKYWDTDTVYGDKFDVLASFPGYLYSAHAGLYNRGSQQKMTQTISGMVQGVYAFAAGAVYRHAWPEAWNLDSYITVAENPVAFMTSNTDTVAIKGFGDEGATLINEADNASNLIYPNGSTISVYQHRHHYDGGGAPAIIALFDSGLFQVEVPVDVAPDGTATVGFLTKNLTKGSAISVYNPTLRYYGSEIVTGIEGVKDNINTNYPNSGVYSITGSMINSNGKLKGLAKGIYIVNGKKYIVK